MATPSSSRTRHRVLIIVLVVAVLLAAVVASYAFLPSVRTHVDEAYAILRMPNDLKQANYSVGDLRSYGYTYSVIRGLAFVPAPLANQGTRAASLAPSGRAAVYSEIVGSTTISRIALTPTVSPARSTIFLQKKGEKGTPLAHGYAPAFLDETHVLYFAPGGIAVLDLGSTRVTLIKVWNATTTLGASVVYSPDRSLVLWTNGSDGQSILARVNATSYEQLHIFSGVTNPVLTNTALYDVRPVSGGTQLWRYALDGKTVKQVMNMPSFLRIVSIFE